MDKSFVRALPLLVLVGALPASSAFAQGRVTFGGGGSGGASTTPTTKPAPKPAPTAATEPAKEETKEEATGGGDAEWQARDRALGEASTLDGGTGLLHTQHLQSGAPGQFRLGFSTEFFSSGFLCSKEQPC